MMLCFLTSQRPFPECAGARSHAARISSRHSAHPRFDLGAKQLGCISLPSKRDFIKVTVRVSFPAAKAEQIET